MPQIFKRRSNTVARVFLIGSVASVFLLWGVLYAVYRSPYTTEVNKPRDQPVQFSHQHHYSGLGIDCRYCHTSVEHSSYAGLPPTHTCMTCHSQVWTDAPILAPVRESLATDTPLQWNYVNDIPDYVFFNHGIHVQKGIGCSTCHGRVDHMPLTWKAHSLYMRWCLDCHEDPAKFIRPREQVFNMAWEPPPDQYERGRQLVKEYHVNTSQLRDCSMCHR
jgi:hypothetical protein